MTFNLPARTQRSCPRLSPSGARARVLAAFRAQGGYEDDGEISESWVSRWSAADGGCMACDGLVEIVPRWGTFRA